MSSPSTNSHASSLYRYSNISTNTDTNTRNCSCNCNSRSNYFAIADCYQCSPIAYAHSRAAGKFV